MRNALQFGKPRGIVAIILGILRISVYCHAVSVGHHRGIVRALHSSLDLEGCDSALHEFGNMLDHTHILGGQNKGSQIVLLNGQRHIGALFLQE